MSKKNTNKEINFVAEDIRDYQARTAAADGGEILFESEAYSSPQGDDGMATTVTKPIGMGGPVPIVAPKHNTIQLQPIIVPLAVVPYMTQDTGSLRTDGRTSPQQYPNNAYAEATEFDRAPVKAVKQKKRGLKPRIFALIIFLLSSACVLPFILSYAKFNIDTKGSIAPMDIITFITNMVEGGDVIVWQILLIIGAGCLAITVVLSLIALLVGKLPKTLLCLSTFISGGVLLGTLIYEVVKKTFAVGDEIIFTATVGVALLTFVLTAAFSFVLTHDRNKQEEAESSVI